MCVSHNYTIKRDLRENISFKFIIGRVGTLFWLLGLKIKSRRILIDRSAKYLT